MISPVVPSVLGMPPVLPILFLLAWRDEIRRTSPGLYHQVTEVNGIVRKIKDAGDGNPLILREVFDLPQFNNGRVLQDDGGRPNSSVKVLETHHGNEGGA